MTVTPLEAVSVNLEDLALFLDGAAEIVASFDAEQCVELRARLDDLATQTRAAATSVDHRLLELLDVGQSCSTAHGQVVVEARGRQTVRGSVLARRLAALIADTPANEDGEALPPGALCQKVADDLTMVFALDVPSATFRKSEVTKRGMKPGEFVIYADGEPKVRFIRG